MAFENRNLGLKSPVPPRTWGYVTPDAAATVDTEGYFNAASSFLRVGDRIDLMCSKDTTPAHGTAVVLSNVGGVVDIGDMSALGGTDTD